MPKVGDLAPDFTLLNQDEKEVRLSDFRGKWIVLYFYPQDDTEGCSIEAIDFTEANPDFEGLDAVILGVSPDSCQSHRKFIEKMKLGITLLSDPEHVSLEAYDVWREKKMFGHAYIGVIRSTFLIDPEGRIAAAWSNVRVPRHVDAVREKLQELLG